jgi:hypothetical protein
MSFAHWLVVLSAIVSISGSYAYIRDTVKGTTKPNRLSWLLWSLAPLIGATIAIFAQADFWATSRIFLAGLMPLLVFLVSFINPKSYWKLTIFDFICGFCSLLALVVWGLVDSPQLAIIFAVAADGFAVIPTVKKAWLFPETETGLSFLAYFVSSVLVIPSIPVWNIQNSAFQIYLIIANTIILFAIYRKPALARLRKFFSA